MIIPLPLLLMMRRGRENVLLFHGKSSLWSQEHASSYLRGVSHQAGSEGSDETGEHPPKCSVLCVIEEGNGNPLQDSCLESPMDGGAWKAAVHGVAEGWTRLSDFNFTFHFHSSLSCIGEGNGNPLQCYCLENPRDGGAWWAAVCGVTQSRT